MANFTPENEFCTFILKLFHGPNRFNFATVAVVVSSFVKSNPSSVPFVNFQI